MGVIVVLAAVVLPPTFFLYARSSFLVGARLRLGERRAGLLFNVALVGCIVAVAAAARMTDSIVPAAIAMLGSTVLVGAIASHQGPEIDP